MNIVSRYKVQRAIRSSLKKRAFTFHSFTAHVLRFCILQTVLITLVAVCYVAGVATKPFEGRSTVVCGIILGVLGLGLLCTLLRRWADVQWIATHIVRVGLLGTVIGLIVAFSSAHGGSTDPSEISHMISNVVEGMYISLYATLFGVGSNLWLKVNLRLLGDFDG